MADPYETVRGSLKFKGVADGGVKKKKKKKSSKAKEQVLETAVRSEAAAQEDTKPNDPRTPAQIAYDKSQEKRGAERILKRAEKTHKQRVEKLNEYLDGLTEHYDIPKVSWTK